MTDTNLARRISLGEDSIATCDWDIAKRSINLIDVPI